jgi:hypothetical protein
MSFKRLAVTATVLCCCAAPAHAQAVKLRFHDGLVTLNTQNAPLRAILSEWARQGGTTIVNGDRVAGPPLSLELNAVPERQALDVLLRSVSGYMLAPRPAGTAGVSVFDRIMILPTSTPPANPPPTQAAGRGFPTPRPLMPQPGGPPVMPPQFPQLPIVPTPDDIEDLEQDIGLDQDVPPVVAPQLRPRPIPRDIVPQPGQPLPFELPQDDPDVDPAELPVAQPARPTPGNPFGLPNGTTSRPGIVTPPPQGVPPRPPRTDPEP